MIILDQTASYPSKVNFVDQNNVFLGYDMNQSCCEHAGWFISNTPIDLRNLSAEHKDAIQNDTGKEHDTDELKDFVFDTEFFQEYECDSDYTFDSGGAVVFRIFNPKSRKRVKPEKFICLFNCQNGYYSHGFEFLDKSSGAPDPTLRDGNL